MTKDNIQESHKGNGKRWMGGMQMKPWLQKLAFRYLASTDASLLLNMEISRGELLRSRTGNSIWAAGNKLV